VNSEWGEANDASGTSIVRIWEGTGESRSDLSCCAMAVKGVDEMTMNWSYDGGPTSFTPREAVGLAMAQERKVRRRFMDLSPGRALMAW
jgi:hypothetical protein